MIFKYEDLLDELCTEFPEIERGSISKICKTGLSSINKLMRSGEELIINTQGKKEIRFFIPSTPEVQAERAHINSYKRKMKQLKLNNMKGNQND